MRHDCVQQITIDYTVVCILVAIWQFHARIGRHIKHVVNCRDGGVIKFQARIDCAAVVIQPRVKVGGDYAVRWARFLDGFFVLFEQFQCEFQMQMKGGVIGGSGGICAVLIGAWNHANLAKFGHWKAQ